MTVPVHAAPLISVVIPTHNMAAYLEEAILSVTEGRFDEVEVLVIDDGSTDDTKAVVDRFTTPGEADYDPRVTYAYQPNGGKASAVNAALRRARGEYVTILDADDRLAPNSLAVRYAAGRAGAQVIVGGTEVFEEEQVSGRRAAPDTSDPRALRRRFFLSYKTPFLLNACLISREVVSRTGCFDTRLRRCQDVDYAIRLLQQTEEVAVVNEPVYRYRKHRQSVPVRLRFRGQTLFYRALVFWKNARGLARLGIVCYGAAMDLAKAIYELFGNYKR